MYMYLLWEEPWLISAHTTCIIVHYMYNYTCTIVRYMYNYTCIICTCIIHVCTLPWEEPWLIYVYYLHTVHNYLHVHNREAAMFFTFPKLYNSPERLKGGEWFIIIGIYILVGYTKYIHVYACTYIPTLNTLLPIASWIPPSLLPPPSSLPPGGEFSAPFLAGHAPPPSPRTGQWDCGGPGSSVWHSSLFHHLFRSHHLSCTELPWQVCVFVCYSNGMCVHVCVQMHTVSDVTRLHGVVIIELFLSLFLPPSLPPSLQTFHLSQLFCTFSSLPCLPPLLPFTTIMDTVYFRKYSSFAPSWGHGWWLPLMASQSPSDTPNNMVHVGHTHTHMHTHTHTCIYMYSRLSVSVQLLLLDH